MKIISERFRNRPSQELPLLARDILLQIKQKGYAELGDVFAEQALAAVEEFARQQCALQNKETFDMKQDKLKNSVVERISENPFVFGLMKAIMHEAKVPYDPQDYHCRIRIKLGSQSSTFDNVFHFDGSYITGVMPVLVPQTSGHLLMAPGMRPYLRLARYDNMSRRLFTLKPLQKFFAGRNPLTKKVKYTQGGMLFFKGFTTLHAGEPASPDSNRIVVLFHIGNK